MTKTQIFLQNSCHGQACCLKTLESRKKPAENKQTAKAVCYLSRYSYSTVYENSASAIIFWNYHGLVLKQNPEKDFSISKAGIELTAELRTKNVSTGFVNQISGIAGVENATLVSYNGEYMS